MVNNSKVGDLMFGVYYVLMLTGAVNKHKQKLSLTGSVSLGVGVMIGAGIFVLTGQIAELVGSLFPIVFIVGAVVVGFSAYSYVKLSNAFPSSGGVASYLIKAYKPGTLAGTFSLLMYASMVLAEGLVAGTFASYSVRLFAPEFARFAPALAVGLLIIAFIVNISGNKIIGTTAFITASIKVFGIGLLAFIALAFTGFTSVFQGITYSDGAFLPEVANFTAALALAILAYKGFTTITNQGADIQNPNKNVGRSIIIAVSLSAIVYIAISFAVASGLSLSDLIIAKDYALAEAAKPSLGELGKNITIIIAIVATVSGVFASVYAASRLLAMLSKRKQIPNLEKNRFKYPALLTTVALAILLSVLFDLTRIASIGAIFYLIMDIAIHWGLVRHLRGQIVFKPLIPLIAIVLDALILIAFIYIRYQTDPFILLVALIGIILIIISERLYMLSHTDDHGRMHMGLEG